MILVFLGKLLVGKGTYAQNVVKKYGLHQLIMGQLLREKAKGNSPDAAQIGERIGAGLLVDNRIVISTLRSELGKVDWSRGIVFDGYPRTEEQAKALDEILAEKGEKVDAAVHFTGPDEVLMARATGRRQCPRCGAVYHLVTLAPKKEGICDQCGTGLVQRKDDEPEIVKQRFLEHAKNSAPVIAYYRKRGILHEIDGSPLPEAVNAEVERFLHKRFGA